MTTRSTYTLLLLIALTLLAMLVFAINQAHAAVAHIECNVVELTVDGNLSSGVVGLNSFFVIDGE